MENKGGDLEVRMVAKGTIKYPDGTEKEITMTSEIPIENLENLEKKKDGNNISNRSKHSSD